MAHAGGAKSERHLGTARIRLGLPVADVLLIKTAVVIATGG